MFKYNFSLTTKIVITLLIALFTLALSWRITRYSFSKIMEPVGRLSEPSAQLQIVNTLFKNIVRLDQMQRIQSSDNATINFKELKLQSDIIRISLDSLNHLFAKDTAQLKRIEQMGRLLNEKERLFLQYLNLRKQYISNDSLNYQVTQLADFVDNISQRSDTSLYSQETSISATSFEQEDTLPATPQKTTLWNKIFKKRKDVAPKEIRHFILEQLKVSVDTSLLQQEDSVISNLSSTISKLDLERKKQLTGLNYKRSELDKASSTLINQLLVVLSEVETVALNNNELNNITAKRIINKGLNTNSTILIGFVLLSVLLAALIFYDILRSNKYKKQLEIAKEQAEELGMVKQKFLSNMSHELRTPLQSIIGYVELLKPAVDKKLQNHVDIVHRSSLHLLHIVNEVLDYSKIVSSGFAIEEKPFKMLPLLQQVIDVISIQANEKEIEFVTDLNTLTEDFSLLGDPFRLKQILFNLLNNAVKFTNKGNVTLRVQQHQCDNEIEYHFSISDTGLGISEDDMSKIFNDFEQLTNGELHQGSGLGLSIVKQLVEKQNGRITVESSVGQGTTFNVELRYSLDTTETTTQKAVQTKALFDFNTTVWIVDDDKLILDLVSKILTNNHVKHRCFDTALALLQTPFPAEVSHVFMDIRMPEFSGIQLVQSLRETIPDIQSVKLTAITAQVLPEERESLMQYGFDDILHKPFLAKELLDMLGVPQAVTLPDKDVDELQTIFIDDTRRDLTLLALHLSNEEYMIIAELLHKLASRLSQMGHKAQGKACRILEIQLRANSIEQKDLSEAVLAIKKSIELLLR